jgi:uncharacterized protein
MPAFDVKSITRNPKKKRGRFISLVVTSNCNLSCVYCYEKHELRDKRIMEMDTAKEAISYYMDEDDYEHVIIEFFGGEPLLAFEFIRDVVDWVHSRSWEKEYRFQIGTNGTILNDEIKEWLYKNREYVNIALSLDGTKKSHDLSRSNSYDMVYKNIPFFRKHWFHQPAKMTICADTIPYTAESVVHLEKMKLLFTANIGFEDFWGDNSNKAKLLEIYEEQLAQLVDYYSERLNLFPVTPILGSVPDYLGIPSIEETDSTRTKRFCGAGHEMVVIDVDGNKYPCHRFIPWVTGKPAPNDKANCQTAWKPELCANCKLIHSCPTCAGFNWEINGDTGIRTTFHCDAFKLEVKASCLLEWKRLQQKLKNPETIPDEDKKRIKIRLDAIGNFIRSDII